MGTERSTLAAQAQIKRLIAELGWTQNRLAEILYTEMNDFDDFYEIQKFKERMKKELQRPTTKVDRLKEYINIIFQHPEAKNLDSIFNKHVPQQALTETMSNGMAEISREIDDVLLVSNQEDEL